MGGCFGARDMKSHNTMLANRIFETIDANNQLQLNNRNLTEYFKEYPESSVKLIMNAMDFNQDGLITRSEWFAYWEYIRRAGYEETAIKKSLEQLQAGTVFLNFPRAESYQHGVPRETLLQGIIKDIGKDAESPVRLQP